MPTFSILVPCYNHARYVGAALESLIAQTDPDWEAVVVNDGSTDESPAILDRFARRDSRIRVFHKANGGVSSALNRAVTEARGDWLCWLSSDDLFEPGKLALHRQWFSREPACRFFFTHYREVNDATAVISDPDLWQPLPDRAMQVIRLMRGNYLPGISICVRRDAMFEAGPFDEGLRVSQDYDMWLRLLAVAPGVFIPDRTCITRVHPGQDSKTQRERCFVEASSACLAFLNRHPFEALFPTVDWTDARQSRQALEEAINVAANPHAFLYGLSPHLALIHRIMEWLWRTDAPPQAVALRAYFCARAQTAVRSQRGNALGHVWRVAWVAASAQPGPCPYTPVNAYAAGCGEYARRLRLSQDATALGQFLTRQGGLSPLAVACGRTPQETLVVMHVGTRVDAPVRYGANRMTVQTAGALQCAGSRVVLAGLSPLPLGTTEGLVFLGAPDDDALRRRVQAWRPRDTVVASSRTDVARWCRPRKLVVHHHSLSFPPGGLSAAQMNRLGMDVLCVSRHSRENMLSFGLDSRRVATVPNGYQDHVFAAGDESLRVPHRVVVAGDLCAGKGTDIALGAVARVLAEYPDTSLHLYGASHVWSASLRAALPAPWFAADGRLDWKAIGGAIPDLVYHGEVASEELATALRHADVLVQASREENFPLVALEAQGCGCLPVMPRQGGMPETVVDGVTGVLYAPNTPEQLAAALLDLWRQPSALQQRRAPAAAWVREHHAAAVAARAFIEALAQVRPLSRRRQLSAALLRFQWALRARLGWCFGRTRAGN